MHLVKTGSQLPATISTKTYERLLYTRMRSVHGHTQAQTHTLKWTD